MNFKIISKRNPIVFLEVTSKFANVESVNLDYIIVDVDTLEIYHRIPQLVKTGEALPSLIESELIYDNGIIRLKTTEEIEADANQVIDDSFCNRNYKVSANLPELAQLYPGIAMMIDKRADIITEFPASEVEDLQVCNIYLDKISDDMCALISANTDLFTVITNPTRDVEVISCKIDTTINNEDGDSIPIIIED